MNFLAEHILTGVSGSGIAGFFSMTLFVNVMIKGAVVLLIAGLLNISLKKFSASVRNWVWSSAFYCLFLIPVLTVLLPGKPMFRLPDVFNKEPAPIQHEWFNQISEETGIPGTASANNIKNRSAINSPVSPDKKMVNNSELKNRNYENNSERSYNTKNYAVQSVKIMEMIWIILFFVLLLRQLLRIAGLFWLNQNGIEVYDKKWIKCLKFHADRLGINRKVRIVLSRHVSVPATFGFFHPVLLLPAGSQNWPENKREVVILHELSHIKRNDFLTNMVSQIVCVFYWFNPLIWLAAKKLRAEQEKACDDRVLAEGMKNRDYAIVLLEIARSLPRIKQFKHVLVSMPQESELKIRLKHILSGDIRRNRITGVKTLIPIITLILFIVPFSLAEFYEKTDNSDRPENFYEIINNLKNANPEIQKRAAWSLGEIEDKEAVPVLLETLKDSNPEVRGMAAWALGEIKDFSAVDPLIQVLSDKDQIVKEIAVKALGELGDNKAVDALAMVLNDKNPDIRYASVWALGEIFNYPAIRAILKALKDPEPNVRETAVAALRRSKSKDVINSIITMLDDPDLNVRIKAAQALGKNQSHEAVPALIKTLADKSPEMRLHSVFALGRIGSTTAVEPLMRLLRDKNWKVREVAVWALDEININ